MKLINKISTIVLGAALAAAVGVSVGNSAKEVKAKNVVSTLTFTSKCNGLGTASDGVTWIVESDSAESNYDGTKGIHYGTGSAAVSYLTLTSASFSNTVSKVVVNCSDANKTADITVKVGITDFLCNEETSVVEASYNNSAYTFTGYATGSVVVSLSRTSAKKALYVKSIAVTYDDGEAVIDVTDVALDKATLSLGIGETYQLKPTINPDDASDKSVSWSSSDESVATVDENGVVEGLKVGTTRVTVLTTDGEFEDYCDVTVAEDGLFRDKLTSASFTASDNSYTPFDNVKAYSKAVYKGSTNKLTDGSFAIKANTFGVYTTKTAGLIKSISVEMGPNSAASAKYAVYGSNTAIKSEEDLGELSSTIISSTNESMVVEPESDYQFFAIKSTNGAPQIASVKIVWEPVKPLSIDAEDTATLTVGASETLDYTLVNNDLIVTETEVEFSSDNASVSVTNAGVITGVSAGSANITIKSKADSTVTKTVAVTVSATKTLVTSVTLDKTELSLNETHTEKLSATVHPEEASIKTVTWSSSDETVATVDQDGKVTGVKAGTATIKVKSTDDEEKYAECAVTVTERPTASYELVTEESQLIVGAKYIVVGDKSDTYYAMGHYVEKNNIPAFEISEPEKGIFTGLEETLDSYAYILGGESGAYTFFDGTNYIYAAGANSNNYLRATDTLSAKSYFEVAFSGSSATVVCTDPNTSRNTLRFNSTLFACYASDSSTGSLPQLYKLVPEKGTAEAYATEFLSQTGAICTASGDHETGLQGIWAGLAEMYSGLGIDEKTKILAGEPSSLIKSMLERYDYLVAKYGLEKFITGHEVSPIKGYFKPVTSNKDTSIVIVAIVSVVSITTLGVLITLKKRKALNK